MTQTKKRVVLVDDEFHIRLLIKTAITAIGCEVVGEGKNGNEAVALFRQHRPDLILLDVNMPEATGEEALGKIIAEWPDALVVMLTSVSDSATVEHCLITGAANYIRKDTPLAEIKAMVAELVGVGV